MDMLHDLEALNREFESASPQTILGWAWERLGPDVVASSSFQTQSVPLLHMIAQVCPQMPVIFLDTGYHFPETLAFRDDLVERLGLNVHNVYPDPQAVQYLESPTEPLHVQNPDLCCRLRKIEPMQRALAGQRAWVSGVRRDQTRFRKDVAILERRNDGLLKVHPMVNWTQTDVRAYRERHQLPPHPLAARGYRSIGCAPCTRPVAVDEDARAGRWAGREKEECGLHTTDEGPLNFVLKTETVKT